MRLPPATLFARPTLADLAALAAAEERRSEAAGSETGHLVRLAAGGRLPPLVMVSLGLGWDVHGLTRHLDGEQPVYVLCPRSPGRAPARSAALTERIAEQLAATLQNDLPGAACVLAGGCGDGLVAFETARRLLAAGRRVPLLALFDVDFPPWLPLPYPLDLWLVRWPLLWDRMRRLSACKALGLVAESVGAWVRRLLSGSPAVDDAGTPDLLRAHLYCRERGNLWHYRPRPYDGRVAIFLTGADRKSLFDGRRLRWRGFIRGPVEVHRIPGDHERSLHEPHVGTTARILQAAIRRAEAS